MLILLNPTKGKLGVINSNCHIRSDTKIICCQLHLWYYNSKKKFFKFCYSIHYFIYIYFLLWAIPMGFLLTPFVILLLIYFFCKFYNRSSKFSMSYPTYVIFIFFGIIFLFILYISLIIQFLPIYMIFIPFILLKYFKSYDQSIYLVCTYNSFCCYPPEYNWAIGFFFGPQSSIFIKTCEKGFSRKGVFKKIDSIGKFFKDLEKYFGKDFIENYIENYIRKHFSLNTSIEIEKTNKTHKPETRKSSKTENKNKLFPMIWNLLFSVQKEFYDNLNKEYDGDRRKDFIIV